MTHPHLSPAAISRIANGQMGSAERASAISHLEACSACRDDVTFLLALLRRRRQHRVAWIGGSATAAMLVVTVFSVGQQIPPDSRASTDRQAPVAVTSVRNGGDVPTLTAYAPENGSTLEGDVVLFAWRDLGPNTHYRIQLSTASGAPLLSWVMRDTSVSLPLASPLEAGRTYRWFVDAMLENGGGARSPVWSFTRPE